MKKIKYWSQQETTYSHAIKNDTYYIARLNFLLSLYPDNADAVLEVAKPVRFRV